MLSNSTQSGKSDGSAEEQLQRHLNFPEYASTSYTPFYSLLKSVGFSIVEIDEKSIHDFDHHQFYFKYDGKSIEKLSEFFKEQIANTEKKYKLLGLERNGEIYSICVLEEVEVKYVDFNGEYETAKNVNILVLTFVQTEIVIISRLIRVWMPFCLEYYKSLTFYSLNLSISNIEAKFCKRLLNLGFLPTEPERFNEEINDYEWCNIDEWLNLDIKERESQFFQARESHDLEIMLMGNYESHYNISEELAGQILKKQKETLNAIALFFRFSEESMQYNRIQRSHNFSLKTICLRSCATFLNQKKITNIKIINRFPNELRDEIRNELLHIKHFDSLKAFFKPFSSKKTEVQHILSLKKLCIYSSAFFFNKEKKNSDEINRLPEELKIEVQDTINNLNQLKTLLQTSK